MSFSKWKILINVLKITFVAIILIFIEILAINASWNQRGLLNTKSISLLIIFLLGSLFMIIVYKVKNLIGEFLDNAIYSLKNALSGNRGEQKTFALLRKIFDEQYRIYPNFTIPDTKFDNDAVIIGPKGIISIEIKNLKGNFEFIGEEVYKHEICRGYQCICKLHGYMNPVSEILRHTKVLEEWLYNKGFQNILIHKFLLMTGERSKVVKLEHPTIYVITSLEKLKERMEEIKENSLFTPEFCLNLYKIFGEKYLK